MKIETEEYNTDINGYDYTVISAATDEGKDIAYELVIRPSKYNGCKLRKYDDDGTVHIYGI